MVTAAKTSHGKPASHTGVPGPSPCSSVSGAASCGCAPAKAAHVWYLVLAAHMGDGN